MLGLDNARDFSAQIAGGSPYRAIFDKALEAIVVTDVAGIIKSANPATTHVFGYEPAEIVGRGLALLLPDAPPPSGEGRPEAGAPVIAGQRLAGTHKDGRSLALEVARTGWRHEGAAFFALLMRDIGGQEEATAALVTLRESEERLRILHNELAHIARVADLGELAVAIAHEINQPLTAIANYLDAGRTVVANEPSAVTLAAARKAMDLAHEQALRAGKIVHGLRDFARKGQETRHVVAADAIADAAMTIALTDLRDTGISLTHEAAGRGALVEADPVQIEQVLMNLLHNAIDALATNPPGAARKLEIITSCEPATGIVEFCVSDTGPGIAPDVRARLFQPFVTSKPAGMGMGLSVCRRIVEAHGGTIAADGPGERGTTFRVRLPLQRMDEG